MRFPSWMFAFLLTGCTDEIIQMMDKKEVPPPFSEVIKNVKVDMNLEEVKKVLGGNLPSLKFTSADESHSWWEFNQRETVDASSTTSPIEERTTILDFDNQGKLRSINASSCLFPDQEPPPEEDQGTKCYKEHVFPVNRELISKVLVRFMLASNFQIGNSERTSLEIISAHGSQSVKDAKERVYVSLTATIEELQKESTQIFMSASYSITEKQGGVGQIGLAGITIPIPLPFNKKEEAVDSGNVSPKYFLTFYDKFSHLLAERHLVYKEPKIAPPAPVVVDKPVEPTEAEKAPPVVVELPNFRTGAIDSDSNLKKGSSEAPNFGSVPIDSQANLEKSSPKKTGAQPVVENVPIDSEQSLQKNSPKGSKPENTSVPKPSNAPIDSGLESTPPKKR
ncbi:conserved hypothetical protein [Gammaproteobacteria bacterium]